MGKQTELRLQKAAAPFKPVRSAPVRSSLVYLLEMQRVEHLEPIKGLPVDKFDLVSVSDEESQFV